MKIGILGRRGGWHVTALQTALARRGVDAPCFTITHLTARLAAVPRLVASRDPLDSYDILLVRAIPGGSLEQIIYRMDSLHRLAAAELKSSTHLQPLNDRLTSTIHLHSWRTQAFPHRERSLPNGWMKRWPRSMN